MPTATERIHARKLSSVLGVCNYSFVLTFTPVNPFSKKESHTAASITTYKVLTILSWLLAFVVTIYYTVNEPHDGFTIRRRIWDQNYLYRTAFTLNSTIIDIYW